MYDKMGNHTNLVGGFNLSEKYARQIGSIPQLGITPLKTNMEPEN